MTQPIWKNPPLYYSLAQLVFNDIPSLEQYIPKIAEHMTSQKFTDYQQVEIDSVQFSVVQGGEAKLRSSKKQQWNFFNKSKKSVFCLSTNTLIFATVEYQGRDHFAKEIIDGIAAINKIAKLDFIDKIGVRHIDLLIPSSGKTPLDYINSQLHGVQVDSLKRVNQTTESVYTINEKQWVVCRTMLRAFSEGIIDPESFMGLIPLNVNTKFNIASTQEIICLDIDAFIQERMDFDLDVIKSNLTNLRISMEPIFINSVSNMALEQWQ